MKTNAYFWFDLTVGFVIGTMALFALANDNLVGGAVCIVLSGWCFSDAIKELG